MLVLFWNLGRLAGRLLRVTRLWRRLAEGPGGCMAAPTRLRPAELSKVPLAEVTSTVHPSRHVEGAVYGTIWAICFACFYFHSLERHMG